MTSAPVIEWRSNTTPFATMSSLAMTGSGYGGAIPTGGTTSPVFVRVYNNFAGSAGIADATNCVLAGYDDTVHQGTAVNPPSVKLYLSVLVYDYSGATSGQDIFFYPIGGATKHAVPLNSGTLAGGSSNYFTIAFQVSIPTNATQGTVSQGVWLEYNSVA